MAADPHQTSEAGDTWGMRRRVARWTSIARAAASVPDRLAHALVLRDLDAWLRLQFLGVASRTGVAGALSRPSSVDAIATTAGVYDTALLEALLEVGVALGEVRRRGGDFEAKGRRLRAVIGESTDLAGLVEELVIYESPIHTALESHLRGEPRRAYLDGAGDAVARASRLAEPVLAPTIRAVVRSKRPRSVLDVGCGTGVYLRHVLDNAPHSDVVGIDPDDGALEVARRTLSPFPAARLLEARLGEFAANEPEPFDLVMLLQNIYYWPPEERSGVVEQLRRLAPDGTVIVASAVPSGPAFNRHLDLVLRVTEQNWRLPTRAEFQSHMERAGFEHTEVFEALPRSGFFVGIGTSADTTTG